MSWLVSSRWSQATPLTMVYSGMPFFKLTSTVEVGHALRWMMEWMPAFSASASSSSPSASSPTALIDQPSAPFIFAW